MLTPNAVTLRPYQEEAIEAIEQAAASGVRRQLLVLPTGTGKTRTFCEWLRRRGGRALILVHTDELVQQTVGTLRDVAPALDVGVVKAELNEFNARHVVVASVQSASRRRVEMHGFDNVIVDEAHHAVAPSYRSLLDHLASGPLSNGYPDPRGPFVLGATATAFRGDGVGLDSVFQAITYEKNILDMIRAGWLCDLRAVSVTLQADFRQLHVQNGDFVGAEVERLLKMANAPQLAVSAYLDHAPGRRALLFTHLVSTAELMAQAFNSAGFAAEVVSGQTPIEERRTILRRFREGTVRVVANAAVLGEGYDEPSVGCVIIARPTRSRVRYTQMIGRGTRTWQEGGKTDCIVLDLVGATERHDLVTTSRLFGLSLRKRESVREADVRAAAEAAAAQRVMAERDRLIAKAVDLFAPKQAQDRRWLCDAERGVFCLSLGQIGGLLVVFAKSDPDSWVVAHSTGSARLGFSDRILPDNLPMELVRAVADEFAKTLPVSYVQPGPPSEPQRRYAKRLGITLAHDATRQEASDAISLKVAGRAVTRMRKRGG